MNSTLLFTQFSSALNWNAGYYFFLKSTFFIKTVILYRVLSTADFTLWTLLNSAIFLLLLWSDCGLRKSVPRFAPQFTHAPKNFFSALLYLQCMITIITAPLAYIAITKYTHDLFFTAITMGIFCIEGILNALRTMHHAYFNNKLFNQAAIKCTAFETIILIMMLPFIHSSHTLLQMVFITKFITSALLILLTAHHPHQNQIVDTQGHAALPYKSFIIHSAIMWITTILKSFSERNFLIPCIMQTIGVIPTNIFKLANDGALVSYRIILKTLGSADTALLAHAHHANCKDTMDNAVKKLIAKVTRLSLPLLGIIFPISVVSLYFNIYNHSVFHAFLIMAIGYILETIFIPYERILEVHGDYFFIFVCYIPYVCMIITLVSGLLLTSIGLLNSLIIIHGVRLVSYIMMRYTVRYLYGI